MSQKTILSFFKQAESSSTKIKSDKSSSNGNVDKQANLSDVKAEKSDINDDTKSKSKLNGDSVHPSSCVNGDAEKSSSKKPNRKSNLKEKTPVTKKVPAKRNAKTLSSPKSPKKSLAKNDTSKVNGKCENSIKDSFNDSPVKQTKKRKRIQLIADSDDEDFNDSEEKEVTSKREDEEMEVDENDESENDADTEATKSHESLSKSPAKEIRPSPYNHLETAKKRKTSQLNKTDDKTETDSNKTDDEDLTTVKKGKSKDSAVLEKNSGVLIIEHPKTARKQIRGGKQKKESLPKTSNLVQEETETSNKSSSSPDKKNKDDNSPEKANETVEQNSKSIEEESQAEEPRLEESEPVKKEEEENSEPKKEEREENSEPEEEEREEDSEPKKEIKKENTVPKKAEKEKNSEPKKTIHPFFAKKKESDTTSSEEKVTKKDIKCSSVTGTSYDPSKTRYHPIDDACWKKGEKTPYLALAKTLEIIEETSARLKIVEILANYLRSVIVLSPEDLLYSVYLCLNRLAPEYEGIELGVGDMLLMKAVAQATGRTVDKIKAEVVVKGDLGLVAESSRGNQRIMFAPPKLTVSSVFSKFKEIAKMSGNTAMSKKVDKIQALFVACRECEARYIIRSLSGKLRIGLAEQSVLAALARAAVLTPPNQDYPLEIIDKSSKMSADCFKELLQEQTLILKTTYCECPNFDMVIPVLLKEGIAGLPTHCHLQPGCPLKPMLAHPTSGINEVLNRFDKNEFTCEYKYDGERAQIHRTDKGEVKIFSRNQEDNTSKYPDIISRLPKALKETTTSFILDTEAVAWDSETKQILPFQVLSTRKKKDAVESDIVVQVCIMAFDLLYLNGKSLVKKPLKERRELLHSSFVEVENEFMFVKYRDGDNAETMQEFLDESVKGNCEGLMVKALSVDASYEIAKRSHNWLKLKKDYLNGIGDTLDLVVIGGYHGKGKRKGFYGGFLLACYDDENEEFQSICKLGTGFSDKELETHAEFFKNHVISEPKSYYRYDSSLEPDVWFDAVQIWEIKCADLSISPVHKAAIGIVDPEKGISLRFPRFLRIREDKSKPEDATVASRIAEMYQKQEQVQNTKNKNMKSEEDYY
ncbi:DNA ligase 1 like protein [Argiope bruennichi]|uniref:DNA ligase n=1 Tax=Argiope bruennichi TaxID=94029 RepID=A0A8T0E850_ARGBR|nr:DNA ligase 1 like protein [Argiope bruennichi]